jgi:glutamate dehydrogenase
VDCSDHEVNIKILLGLIQADGELTEKQRNKLLAEMTDEVAALVLADNYYQTQSLSVSGVRAEKLLDAQASFIRALEKAGKLNRAVEYLPSDDEIAERRAAKHGLTAPERAVLLAYSKMVLSDDLVAGTLVDDAYVARSLVDYFPTLLQKRYTDVMSRHPLKRDIIATVVANTMINRTGSVFIHRMQEETGAASQEVARAYILTRDIFELEAVWREIDALDNRVPAQLQYEMLTDVGRLVVRSTLWFLRRRREKLPIAQVLEIFRPALAALRRQLPAVLSPDDRMAWNKSVQRVTAQGVPRELAERYAALEGLYAVLDVTEVAMEQGKPIETIAALYFALVGELELRWFGEKITQLPTDTLWQALARNALRDDLATQQRVLTSSVAKLSEETDPARMLAVWEERYAPAIARLKAMTDELKRAGTLDLAVLSVLLRELRSLA